MLKKKSFKFSLLTRWLKINSLLVLLVASFSQATAAVDTRTILPLDSTCSVNILNRTIQANEFGRFALPNIPSFMGQVRARATCVKNGVTTSGQTDYFSVVNNSTINVGKFYLAEGESLPTKLEIVNASPIAIIELAVQTQLIVNAHYADSTIVDVSAAINGTNYQSTNSGIVTVSPDGALTGISSGSALITVRKDGVVAIVNVLVTVGGDSDNDGLPDSYENLVGLNPLDPVDALEDQDLDGLTALEEFNLGTNPNVADTDGDNILDGEEIIPGKDGFITSPLLADTDSDGLNDGLEISVGSDPTNINDFNLAAALSSISITPASPTITFNAVESEASTQIKVTGQLIDGNSIDLTDYSRGTVYSSSDLIIVSFGSQPGQLFGGQAGAANVTVTNNGHQAVAIVSVTRFDPTALGYIDLAGPPQNVDTEGDFAYVAAGNSGLHIVDVSNRASPVLVKTVSIPGSASDVRVQGNYAYVTGGSAGLSIVDVTEPTTASILTTVDTLNALDVFVVGNYAYVADGSNGLAIINVTNPPSAFLQSQLKGFTANGLAVDGNLAAIVGQNTLFTVNVSDPANPAMLGSVNVGVVYDVALSGNYAHVAAYTLGYKVFNVINPATPQHVGTVNNFYPVDVSLSGDGLAFFAEYFFVSALPFVNITLPTSPVYQGFIDFSKYRDDDGNGLDVDSQYAYMTTAKGRLYIAQYRVLNDTALIPPVINLTKPAFGKEVYHGGQLLLSADASDDIFMSAVNFEINGDVVFTDTHAPYEFIYRVPTNVSGLAVSATAVDTAGNIGYSESVLVNVLPDPLTTVTGRVIDRSGQPISGASVEILGGQTSSTALDGTFSIPDVPTLLENVQVRATAIIDSADAIGLSVNLPIVRGGISNLGDIVVSVLQPLIPVLASPTSSNEVGIVTASTSYEDVVSGLHKAMDNDLSTRWVTNTSVMGQWLKWSFTSPQIVQEFEYTTLNSLSTLLEYSDDNLTWHNASAAYVEEAGSFIYLTTTGITPHPHWRLIVNQVSGGTVGNWYGYNRFQLYGTNPPRLEALATTASGTYTTYVPENATDGVPSGRWNAGGYAPQWIYVDLGSIRPISGVKVLAGTGYPPGVTYYDVQVSDDAISWATVANGTSSNLWGITNFSANGRYVRLYINSHSGGSWIGLSKFFVY